MSAANHPVSVPIAGRTSPANLTLPAPVRVVAGCITISGSGGGGSSTLAGLTDVTFPVHPTAGQALVYDGVNDRWTNGRPAWTLPDWASTHIYEPGDTVYHQGQFWRNIQTLGANNGHEPKLLKAEAIGWFRHGGHTLGPLYPEFVETGDTSVAPTGTIATHFGAHYAVKYHSDTDWTVWEWKVVSHGPPITFGWHKLDVAHKVTHRHYAEPSPVTAEETGLLWIFDEPGSTSVPVVPQRYWEPVVLGDYLVSLADVDASKAVAGDTLVLDANGRWVATPVGTTPGGGGLDIATANSLYQPKLAGINTNSNIALSHSKYPAVTGEVGVYSDGIEAFHGFIANGTEKTFAIGASYETQGYRIGSEIAVTADVGAFEGKTEISSYQYETTGVKTPIAKLTVSGAGLVADCPNVDGSEGASVTMSSQAINFRVNGLANDPLDTSFQFQPVSLLNGGGTSQPTFTFGSAKVMDYRHPIIQVSRNGTVGSDGNSGEVYAYNGTGSITLTLAAGRLETFFYVANLGTGTVTLVPQNSNYKIIGSKTLTKTGEGKGWKVTKVVGGNGQGTWLVQDADSEAGGLDIATANGLYLAKPATATANQVLTYNGTAWGAANATTGNLSLYVPRTSNAPLVIETTEQAASAVGITIISRYNQYSSNLTIDGSAGFSLQDMRGSTVKSTTQGEVLILPDTAQGPTPTKIRVLVGQVDIPVGPRGVSDPTGGITIQQDGTLKALVAPANSTFADPLSYITSGYADATYLRTSASLTLPYLTQDVASTLYPTMDGSATGKFAAYTENAPGYSGQYVMPDGKVMTIQNGAIVSIA